MKGDGNQGTEPVRLLFEMSRADNPRLYDDLIRFNKGTKRVNRLRYLAHEGLLAQGWMLVQTTTVAPDSAESELHALVKMNRVAAGKVVQAFDAPLATPED